MSRTVTVVGGGVAGLSAACALAEAGWEVTVVERRAYLGGRASSFFHPGAGEVIDNCQHVLFGCCTGLQEFYRRIGVAERIEWTDEMTMLERDGSGATDAGAAGGVSVTRLGSAKGWPAPLHGVPSLLAARAFGWKDKLALARGFLAMMRWPRGAGDTPEETLAAWLKRKRQTPRAIERFWKLVLASALNSDPEQVGMEYAAMVVKELFLKSAAAGRMGRSKVPLGELYEEAVKFINARGGRVLLNARLTAARREGEKWKFSVATASATGSGGRIEVNSDAVVFAVPAAALARVLPLVDGGDAITVAAERFQPWPICSVHLWYDRAVTDLPHAVLLDCDFHWMYNHGGGRIELVVSAARDVASWGAQRMVDAADAAVRQYFPGARGAALLKSAAIKEVNATFAVPPGIDSARPGPRTALPGLYLAGDWTRTGWPSTMEGAARSGHLAAEAILGDLTPSL